MTAIVDTEDFVEQWTAWHQVQEARRGNPHGFLAVTSINWLTDEPQRFSDAPGEWTTGEAGVHVVLAAHETIVAGGREISDRYDLGVLAERAGVTVRWRDGGADVAACGTCTTRPVASSSSWTARTSR